MLNVYERTDMIKSMTNALVEKISRYKQYHSSVNEHNILHRYGFIPNRYTKSVIKREIKMLRHELMCLSEDVDKME